MKEKIVDNLFGLWKLLGSQGEFLSISAGYSYVTPKNNSWPYKTFALKPSYLDFEKLYRNIEDQSIPSSIAILENEELESQLLNHGFRQTSSVKAMHLDLKESTKPKNRFDAIEKVDNEQKAVEFAKIASNAFGYEVLSSTIIPVLSSSRIKLFIGKHNYTYASCGIALLDKNNITGLHMIGTLPEYQKLGLGKTMTNKLLFEAYENGSNQVVLVASEAGERIYSKLGFAANGKLNSYTIGG